MMGDCLTRFLLLLVEPLVLDLLLVKCLPSMGLRVLIFFFFFFFFFFLFFFFLSSLSFFHFHFISFPLPNHPPFLVAVVDLHADGAKAVADEINAAGGEAIAIQADVSKDADMKALFEETEAKFGKVNVVFNNAGNFSPPLFFFFFFFFFFFSFFSLFFFFFFSHQEKNKIK